MLATVCAMLATLFAPCHGSYSDALTQSLRFYRAQRSGRLPDDAVPWRGDSFLNDRTRDGVDVTGGYFDAGDHVKFLLPQATTLSTLASSIADFRAGYEAAGQYWEALRALKWGTTLLRKCVVKPGRVVGQIGNGRADHARWSRPEDVAEPYPVYELNGTHPGADVVGAMSAALAAASVVFRRSGQAAYADLCRQDALTLFTFGTRNPGLYHLSIPDAAAFYKSTSQYDDLSLAAAWLHRATGDDGFKTQALTLFRKHATLENGLQRWVGSDWDNQVYVAAVQLARLYPDDAQIQQLLQRHRSAWVTGAAGVKRTPAGLMWLTEWGTLRHSANAALVIASARMGDRESMCFAQSQIDYMLGRTGGRSFVVGFGPNAPTRPHHRASSCPPRPSVCNWNAYHAAGPNPYTLHGALVGGPGVDDSYVDSRDDYVANEVAIDYNAGFTGVLAALVQFGGCA